MNDQTIIGLCIGIAFGIAFGSMMTRYAYESKILKQRMKEYEDFRLQLRVLYESARKKMTP